MKLKTLATATMTTVVLAVGGVGLFDATASAQTAAAGSCGGNGPLVTDPGGHRYPTTYCRNYVGGALYNGAVKVGYLNAGRNWFACQKLGAENPAVGGARNNYWLYTKGDKAYADGGWGWFPATMVSGGGNYERVPDLSLCDRSTRLPK
ncbi:hypothetical protein ABT294_03380 [Nonomuraea sp. NPDC000554]|uniref:hypothetical protein n=1 Tax=Nonomuraea sp. NPDC000554 TaxID=3154259 RepID=UPI003318A84F